MKNWAHKLCLLILFMLISVLGACTKKNVSKQKFTLRLGALSASGTTEGGTFVAGQSTAGSVLIKLDSTNSAEFIQGNWDFQIVSFEGASAYSGRIYCGSASAVSVLGSSVDLDIDITEANCANEPLLSLKNKIVDGYKYATPMAVSSISPAFGALNGGTNVTIKGSSFYDGVLVKIGNVPCLNTILVDSSTITCTTARPSGVSTFGNVDVTNSDARSASLASAFEYVPAPSVASITPNAGSLSGLTTVTIKGANFKTGATVSFGGSPCLMPVWIDASTLTCSTPAHAAGMVLVQVTNPDGQIGSSSTISSYTYQAAPVVSSIAPSIAYSIGGNILTISGSGFLTGVSVDIDGVICPNIVLVNSSTIKCTAPVHLAGSAVVTVMNADTQKSVVTNKLIYQDAPVVQRVSPQLAYIIGGNTLSVIGTGFVTGATVLIDTATCTNVTVVDSKNITCIAPAHAIGTANITVTNADGQTSTLNSALNYPGPPTLSFVSPKLASASKTKAITLTGSGFLVGATVTVGTSVCTSPTVVTDTTLTCTAPALVAGAYEVKVTNPDTQSVILTTGLTYQDPPTIAQVAPLIVATRGGDPVTITGTNFYPGMTVSIGGLPCNNALLTGTTSLTCISPPLLAGIQTVSVMNTDTQTASFLNGITYKVAPTITSVVPGAGVVAGGTTLTITGSGFFTGITFTVAGINCGTVTVTSPTSATCITGVASASGVGDVVVKNLDPLEGRLVGGFTYVNSIQPASLTSFKVYDSTGVELPNNSILSPGQIITLKAIGSDINNLPIEFNLSRGSALNWGNANTTNYTVQPADLGIYTGIELKACIRNNDGINAYVGSIYAGDGCLSWWFTAPGPYLPAQIKGMSVVDVNGTSLANNSILVLGQTVTLSISATDPNNLPIEYNFSRGSALNWGVLNTSSYTVTSADIGISTGIELRGCVRNSDGIDGYVGSIYMGDGCQSWWFKAPGNIAPPTITQFQVTDALGNVLPNHSLLALGQVVYLQLTATDPNNLLLEYNFSRGSALNWGVLNTSSYTVTAADIGVSTGIELKGCVRNSDGVNSYVGSIYAGDGCQSWWFTAQ